MFRARLSLLPPSQVAGAKAKCEQYEAENKGSAAAEILDIVRVLSYTSQRFCAEFPKFIKSLGCETDADASSPPLKHEAPKGEAPKGEAPRNARFIMKYPASVAFDSFCEFNNDIIDRRVAALVEHATKGGKLADLQKFVATFSPSPLLFDRSLIAIIESYEGAGVSREQGAVSARFYDPAGWGRRVSQMILIQRIHEAAASMPQLVGEGQDTKKQFEEERAAYAAAVKNSRDFFCYTYALSEKFRARFLTREAEEGLADEYFGEQSAFARLVKQAAFVWNKFVDENNKDSIRDEFNMWKLGQEKKAE